MSKSKHAAQAPLAPAPKQGWNPFRDEAGRWRAGWLLALSLAAYLALSLAVRAGLGAAYTALFDAWRINADNAHLAPAWARLVYAWHGSSVTALAAVAALCLSQLLIRLWSVSQNRPKSAFGGFALAGLTGLLAAAMLAALCLLPDSMRLEWPLSRPHFDGAQPVLLLLSLLGVLAEEVFLRRVLQDGLRGRWGEGLATACAAMAFVLVGGWPGSLLGALNALLLGLVCGWVYARGGLWHTVGFRWGWSVANVFLLGFGGGSHAVYRLYGVSERWLTGGDAGLTAGLWATLALCAALAWLGRERIRRTLARLRATVLKRV